MLKIFHTILDIIFPHYCVGCSQPGDSVCDRCLQSLSPASHNPQAWIWSRYSYQDPIMRACIHHLKNHQDKQMVEKLTGNIADYLLEELADNAIFSHHKTIVIPIPIHKKNLRKRGFNQTQSIANALRTILPLTDIDNNVLYKRHPTKKQALIKNRSERLRNIVGSFGVRNPHLVKGKHIILIDDVTTTGATLSEARKVLLGAGAKSVLGITIAH